MTDDVRETAERTWARAVGGDVHSEELTAQRSYAREVPEGAAYEPEGEEPVVAIEKIASGGMGDVFRARQTHLRREVAMKKLRPERRLRASASRAFLAEAIITGQLEHPNIVPVYSLGSDPSGDLFLAMKLVGGVSWSERLREDRPWKDGSRLLHHLEVLLQVGNAVAFAHSKAIVHNDLKPSNVMLGDYGEVLVLDWGLAVDIAEPPSALGLPHRSRLVRPCGTPAYLPPELASGDGPKIGPWTDVYLLGGILCEILTGRPPHRGRQLMDAIHSCLRGVELEFPPHVPEELQRICLRALEASPEARHPSVPALQAELRAYLRHSESFRVSDQAWRRLRDCRSTSAEEEQLYETYAEVIASFKHASELWEGNQRAREGVWRARTAFAEAGLARGDLGLAASQLRRLEADDAPDEEGAVQLRTLLAQVERTRAERARSRRHKVFLQRALLAAGVLLIVGLVGFLVVVRDRNARIEEEKQRVAEAKEFSDQRGDIARHALTAVTAKVVYSMASSLQTERSQKIARELLTVALEGWEKLRDANLAEDEVSWGSAFALAMVGHIELLTGDTARGKRDMERSIALTRPFLDDPELGEPARLDLARSLGYLARAEQLEGNTEEGLIAAREAVELMRVPVETDSLEVFRLENLAAGLVQLGGLLQNQRRADEALACFEESLALERALAEDGGDRFAHLRVLHDLRVVGNAHFGALRLSVARTLFDEQLAKARAMLADHPDDPAVVEQLVWGLCNQARLHFAREELAEAEALLDEALEHTRWFEVVISREDKSFRHVHALAYSLLAELRSEQQRSADAIPAYREAIERYRVLVDSDPHNMMFRDELVRVLQNFQHQLLVTGREEEAEQNLRELIRLQRAEVEADSLDLRARVALGVCLLDRSDLATRQGQAVEAFAAAEEGLACFDFVRARAAEHPDLLANVAGALRRMAEAERLRGAPPGRVLALAEEALAAARKASAGEFHRTTHHALLLCLQMVAEAQARSGQAEAAFETFAESAVLCREILERDPDNFEILGNLSFALQSEGRLLALQGAYDLADARFREAQEVQAQRHALPHTDPVDLLLEDASLIKQLGVLGLQTGDFPAARASFEWLASVLVDLQGKVPDLRFYTEMHDCLYNLTLACRFSGAPDDALAYAEESLAVAEALLEVGGAPTARLSSLIILGDHYLSTRRIEQASELFEAAVELQAPLLADASGDPDFLQQAADVLESSARARGMLGDFAVAEARFHEAIALTEQAIALDPTNLGMRRQRADLYKELAMSHAVAGQPALAIAASERCLAEYETLVEAHPQLAANLRRNQAIHAQLVVRMALPDELPRSPDVLRQRVHAELDGGDPLLAVGYVAQLLKLGAGNVEDLRIGTEAAAVAAARAEEPLREQLEALTVSWLGSLYLNMRDYHAELAGHPLAQEAVEKEWRALLEAPAVAPLRERPDFPPLLD